MKVSSSKRALGITVLLLLMLTEGYTKPQNKNKDRQRSPRQRGPPGQEETSEQSKQQRVFGELPPLGQEVKRCSQETPRRLVGARMGQTNRMDAKCDIDINTASLNTTRPITAGCDTFYTMFPGAKLKVNMARGPESQCAVFAEAADNTKLRMSCRAVRLNKDCNEEYFYLATEETDGMYCRRKKPDRVQGASMVFLFYERMSDTRYRRSRIVCLIKAKKDQGSGTDGSSTDGSVTDGSGTDGSVTDGSGTDGSVTDGSGTDGSGTDGNTNSTESAGLQLPNCEAKCGASQLKTGIQRIVGGSETRVHEYPWMIYLRISTPNEGGFLCGASVITNTQVLTAAHCVDTPGSTVTVIAGEHNIADNTETTTQSIQASDIVKHPNYKNLENDIAILHLSEPLEFGDSVQPVCLAREDRQYEGKKAIVTGWGTTKENGDISTLLQEVELTVVTNEECLESYPSSIPDSMVCASEYGKDSCQGDSGGPLVMNDGGIWYQVGVVSWGKGCAQEGYPGVYTRVTSYIDWISSEIKSKDGSCKWP
ncbi:hypothetical protein Pcinc_010668 [Petrolisthes cinctipes]|uniref:Peptidase S1 domain-containing protein n=1 Tax=Petrolisthes cinctipes TaxID=88211 RepID=A0AAE1G2N4_PETCI|nr:hypothetical protein Pcinc_010668 [Petrolisthes cinctipes]